MSAYLWLTLSVVCEVIATTALKESQSFTRLIPSVICILGYGAAFYGLSRTLNALPIGVAYALWSAIGTVLIALIGWLVYQQSLNFTTMIGLLLVISGIIIVQLATPYA